MSRCRTADRRPPAPPTPTPGATSSATRSGAPRPSSGSKRLQRPGPRRPRSTSCPPSASTCWDGPCSARVIRQMAESVLRQAQRRHPGDVWLNYDLARCLEQLAAARRRSATTRPRARFARRRRTSWRTPWKQQGRDGRGDRGVPGPGPAAARRTAAPRLPGRGTAARGRVEGGRGVLDAAIAACREGSGQARRRGPTTTSASPCGARVSCERRSPHYARRSGSSPTTPWSHTNLGLRPGHREAGGGHRRVPRGDPPRARLCR